MEPRPRPQDPVKDACRDGSDREPQHWRSQLSAPRVVVFLDHAAVLGGGEIALSNLIEHLNRDAWQPTVILGEVGPLADRLEASGIDVEVISLSPRLARIRQDALGAP